jgi:predicted N-acetyltransferase YhbS
MERVKIRKLEESDAECVSQIIIRGFNWFFKFHEGRKDYVETCKRFREAHKPERIREFARAQGDNVRGFVAEADGKVVGYIAISFKPGSRLGV